MQGINYAVFFQEELVGFARLLFHLQFKNKIQIQ
jgi:hypothetical protein